MSKFEDLYGNSLDTKLIVTNKKDGLMSKEDKAKLDSIDSEASKVNVDATLSPTSTNPLQNKVIHSELAKKSDINHDHMYAGSSSIGGSANSAEKLTNSRLVTIGNVTKSFDGTADISFTQAEIATSKVVGYTDFGGTMTGITTAEFIQLLKDKGAFDQRYWIARGSWSYVSNNYITDTNIGNIQLAGAVVEVISSSVNLFTIRIHSATTTTGGVNGHNSDFIYVYNGESYNPGWRRLYSNIYPPKASEIPDLATAGTTMYSKRLSGNEELTFGQNSLQYFNTNTTATNGPNNASPVSGSWSHIIRMNHANTKGYFADIALPLDNSATSRSMSYRVYAGSEVVPWRTVLDSDNYKDYLAKGSGYIDNSDRSLSTTVDWNTLTESKSYHVSGTYSLSNNAPATNLAGHLVVRKNSSYLTQLFISRGGEEDNMYFRGTSGTSNLWSSWKKVLSSDNYKDYFSLSNLGVNLTSTELNYLKGATSNIQSQLNTKAESLHEHINYTDNKDETLGNTVDWNTVKGNVAYCISGTYSTSYNAPKSGSLIGHLITRTLATTSVQLYISRTDGDYYFRGSSGDAMTWNPWRKLSLNKHKHVLDDIITQDETTLTEYLEELNNSITKNTSEIEEIKSQGVSDTLPIGSIVLWDDRNPLPDNWEYVDDGDDDVVCRDNILKNSDFKTEIINQRGDTTYSTPSKYTIDGWILYAWKGSGTSKLDILWEDGKIKITNSGYEWVSISQLLDRDYGNNTLTGMINVANITSKARIMIADSNTATGINNAYVLKDNITTPGLHIGTYNNIPKRVTYSYRKFVIQLIGNGYIEISNTKLELGSSYTGMPLWNKNNELIAAWRKYQELYRIPIYAANSTNLTYFVAGDFFIPMEKTPSCVFTEILSNNAVKQDATVTNMGICKNKILNVTLSKNIGQYGFITVLVDAGTY